MKSALKSVMICRAGVLAALMLVATSPAAAAVRAVYVGIDRYKYAADAGPGSIADLKDLHGAVADTLLIRRILTGPRWHLPADTTGVGDPCPVTDDPRRIAPSVTLLDACATRAAILAAITNQIAAASDGDTLLFYFAGHGSTTPSLVRKSASGEDQTRVSHDSRGGGVTDIRDGEIAMLFDAAAARGVHAVLILDSCHAGSGDRDLRGGVARAAPPQPPVTARPNDVLPPPPRPHATAAYHVLLAAAADDQTADEKPVADDVAASFGLARGEVHGLYTIALAQALAEAGALSYADIAADIHRRLLAGGAAQTPSVSGDEAVPFLGRGRPADRIFHAEPAAGAPATTVTIAGGAITGVTMGSTYDLYPSRGAAAQAGGPGMATAAIGTGQVVRVAAADADLALVAPLTGRVPADLAARERVHAYDGPPIKIGISGATASQRDAILAALAPVTAISAVPPPADPDFIFDVAQDAVQLRRASDGAPVGDPVPADADRLADGIATRTRQLARYFAVLGLANDNGRAWATFDLRYACDGLKFPQSPPVAMVNGEARIYAGDIITVRYGNANPDAGLFPYLIGISASLRTGILRPPDSDLDSARLYAGTPLDQPIFESSPGRDVVMLLLTDAPIDTGALTNQGAIDPGNSRALSPNPLERLLAAADHGQTARDIVRVNAWGARALAINVLPASARHGGPPCPPPPPP